MLMSAHATFHMTAKNMDVTRINLLHKMGCPALGIWVGFLKQPALPGEAPPQKNSSKKF
jgi:hypothetical protein